MAKKINGKFTDVNVTGTFSCTESQKKLMCSIKSDHASKSESKVIQEYYKKQLYGEKILDHEKASIEKIHSLHTGQSMIDINCNKHHSNCERHIQSLHPFNTNTVTRIFRVNIAPNLKFKW